MHLPLRAAGAAAGVTLALLLGAGAHSLAADGHHDLRTPAHSQAHRHSAADPGDPTGPEGPPDHSPGGLSGNVVRPAQDTQD